jgi:hypothetical protein
VRVWLDWMLSVNALTRASSCRLLAEQKGSTVKVHYSGRIEGAEVDFDSTYDAKKKKQNPLCVRV